MSDLIFLKGKRVVLRPLLESDIPSMLRWINDPEVNQYLCIYTPQMEQDQKNWLERVRESQKRGTDLVFAIETSDGECIGNMGIHGISWKDRTATTGALIGEEEYWGKGYGTEAKMLLLDYAFNTLNLRKIYSSVIAFNGRSRAYSLKCGYKEEGVRKDHWYRKGQYWDEILLAVFKEDWLPLWKKFKEESLS